MYQTQAGNVTNLSCDPTNNQQLYFRKEAFRMETSRRSLTISDLPLDNTAALCPEEDIRPEEDIHVTGKSVCILLLCVHEIFLFSTPVVLLTKTHCRAITF